MIYTILAITAFIAFIVILLLYVFCGFNPIYFNYKNRFRLRYTEPWWSQDYLYLKYTNSYGLFWTTIYYYIRQDVITKEYGADIKTIKKDNLKELEKFINNFKTIGDCELHNANVFSEVRIKNAQLKEDNRKFEEIAERNKKLINRK